MDQERKVTKQFLSTSLKLLIEQEKWKEVATIKEKLRKMLLYESMGLVIRSRQKEYAEEERGGMYYHNKEMKKTGSNHLNKMKYKDEEGNVQITTNADKIANVTVNFYEALFNGRHDKNLVDTGQPFQPSEEYLEDFLNTLSTLSEQSKAKLARELSYDEVKQIVKDCPRGRAPGLDGLTYEFYQTTWDVIGEHFTEVIKWQLRNFTLIESGKHGVTALPSKVSGVPIVTDLLPLTLLCCDYRIL